MNLRQQAVTIVEEELEQLLTEVMQTAGRHGFSEARALDIRTAIEEACRNALEHSSVNVRPSIRFAWGLAKVTVSVKSEGTPFEIPTTKPDLQRKLSGEERPRGWGLYLIRSLADEVSVETHRHKNELRMTFNHRTTVPGDDRG